MGEYYQNHYFIKRGKKVDTDGNEVKSGPQQTRYRNIYKKYQRDAAWQYVYL